MKCSDCLAYKYCASQMGCDGIKAEPGKVGIVKILQVDSDSIVVMIEGEGHRLKPILAQGLKANASYIASYNLVHGTIGMICRIKG